MHNITDRGLLVSAAAALTTVWLLEVGIGLAAAFAAAATLLALRGRAFAPLLAALPTLLAAMPGPEPRAATPRPGPVRVEGQIVSLRTDRELGTTSVEVRTGGGMQRVTCTGSLQALPGDRIVAIARCSVSSILDEPDPVQAAPGAIAVERGPWSLPATFAMARARLEREIEAIGGEEHAAFLSALTLGNGSRVSREVADAHRATGLSHLLAVSGAHAAMLAWMLGLQPFGGGRRRPVGRMHLAAAMLALLAYGAITGMEPPMFRALCGYALVAIGLRTGRQTSAAQALLWPALASAVLAPRGTLTESFCLSYAAVFGLSLAGPPRGHGWFERFVAAPVRASFWATAMTAPLTLAFFGQLAPWTILLTPILSPIIAALLLSCLIGAVLGALGAEVAGILHAPVSSLADLYLSALAIADRLPGTPAHATSVPSPWLLAAACIAAACVLLRAFTKGNILLALGTLAAPHFLSAQTERARVELFAVGHGQSCLLALEGGVTALVDCGSQQRPALAARKVERALRRRRIDLLVLTHGDADHTAGVAHLLRRLPVDEAVLPTHMRASAVHQELALAGSRIRWLAPGEHWTHPAGLSIRAPHLVDAGDNDASLWVRASLRGWSILLTGDAEEAGVADAVRNGLAQPADVLVLPHHGRPNAEVASLLRAVVPSMCLVSNERGDSISALGAAAAALGVPAFATAVSGDLTVDGDLAPRVRAAMSQDER